MPYRYLRSALQFMTMSLPKYLLCEGRLFLIRHFLFPGISTPEIAHRVEQREEVLCCAGYYPHLTSHFKAPGAGLIPVSTEMPATEKIFAVFLQINWNGFLQVTLLNALTFQWKPRVRQKTMEKWQASWWEFFAVTLLSPLEKKPLCSQHK